MKQLRTILLTILGAAVFMAGCKKYETAPQVAGPAYMRVFNDLTTTINVFNSAQTQPFLTFLMDPNTGADGVPTDAGVIGDYMTTRLLFSKSFPSNEANSSIGNGTIGPLDVPDQPVLYPQNYEYPGNARVPAAPVINGFDLSSWAQVPAGKHRMMFVVRPQNGTPFKQLSQAQRGIILLDTTVDFEKGEVYTLEVVSRDLDKGKYGLYVRKENFIHQTFDEDRIYAGFVNLSGVTPADSANGTGFYFPRKVKINSTYFLPNDAKAGNATGNSVFDPMPDYNNIYLTTINTKMGTDIDYSSFPTLPASSFFKQGALRNYGEPNGFTPITQLGNIPYVSFTLVDADAPIIYLPQIGFQLDCYADPSVINNYNANTTEVIYYQPSLNLLANINGTYHVYGTVNIMELVYNRVYMMQIKWGINDLPSN